MLPKYRPRPLDAKARDFLESIVDSDGTRATYANALKAFYSFRLSARRGEPTPTPLALRALDKEVLAKFYHWLTQRGYSRFTKDTYIAGAAAFLEYAADQGWLSEAFALERARYHKRKAASKNRDYPIPPIDEHLPQLITYYDGTELPTGEDKHLERLFILRARALLHVLYSTAGRISEVAQLTRKDVQDGRKNETIVVGKGDKERILFFTSAAQSAIKEYLRERQDAYEYLFISHQKHKGQPLSRQMLWKIVADTAAQLGMKAHPHDFRHYRASQMLEQGAPLEAIQEILGHKDISTTRRVYAHYQKKGTLRAIFDRTTLSPSQAATG